MISKKVTDGYFLVLEKDERLVATLTKFCTDRKIKAAYVSGIGAVQSATLGYYQLGNKRYKFKKLNRLLEISSLTGNVSTTDGEPFLHIHTVLSDGKLRAYGGHLKEAKVGGTCEVYLQQFSGKFERQTDADTGLNLIK